MPTERLSDRDVFFISIPRTGTHSIHAALDGQISVHNHVPARVLRRLVGEERWQAGLSFAVVRNPFDRLVSFHTYCQRAGVAPHIFRVLDFPRWLDVGCPTHWAADREHGAGSPTSKPLSLLEFVADDAGTPIIVDHVLRFECLDADLARFCEQAGLTLHGPLEQILKTRPKGSDYRGHYPEPWMRRRVEGLFRKDLEVFDYDF